VQRKPLNHSRIETIDLLRSGKLQGIKRLDLAAGLTEFPIEIFDLADSLEILNLSDNCLRSLPADLGRLNKLKVIFLSNNDFEEVPEVLADCPNLSMVGFKSNKIRVLGENVLPLGVRWLILTDNQLEKLPNSIASLALEKLEVRAFGCLLEDLLNRCQLPVDDVEKLTLSLLVKLQQNCLQSSPAKRPLFMSIVKILVRAIHELPLSQEK
jgi:Leucine-rich repeat (LRR) protein